LESIAVTFEEALFHVVYSFRGDAFDSFQIVT
jgi:hypothetical protein